MTASPRTLVRTDEHGQELVRTDQHGQETTMRALIPRWGRRDGSEAGARASRRRGLLQNRGVHPRHDLVQAEMHLFR